MPYTDHIKQRNGVDTMQAIKEAVAKLEIILNTRLKAEGLPYVYRMDIEPGKVYARIVRREIWPGSDEAVNGSVYGFVKLEDLTLWKAAGFKAPAKNKARGVLEDLTDPEKVLPRWQFSIS